MPSGLAVVPDPREMELNDDVDLVLATSIDEFEDKIAADSKIIERIICVINDFWFEKENALELNVVGKIRFHNYTGPIYLSSNIGNEYNTHEFTLVIPKHAMNWTNLQILLAKKIRE